MNLFEKSIVIFYFIYLIIYIPCFVLFCRDGMPIYLLPFHVFGTLLENPGTG